MAETFDFIIVGGGTSGCLLAYRLANATKKPSVLLLENGPDNTESIHLIPQERYSSFVVNGRDYGYASQSEPTLNNRSVPYARGKGLGGSSVTNFMNWIFGPSEDYDRWAEECGDDAFKWTNVKERLKKIERLHNDTPEQFRKYAFGEDKDHGFSGLIDVSFPSVWEKEIEIIMKATERDNYVINPDHNSGQILGHSISICSTDNHTRTTSATATMTTKPDNLIVRTNTQVVRVVLEDKVATGVIDANGIEYHARKEVLLSAGPFDTPKLLLLSGIGPAPDLASLSIPVSHHLPGVGQNLRDHIGTYSVGQMSPSFSSRATFLSTNETRIPPREQWQTDQTGYYTNYGSGLVLAFLRDEALLSTPEFHSLPPADQAHLRQSSIPHFELTFGAPPFPGHPVPEDTAPYLTTLIVHNTQSRGSITLASANPADKPILRINSLSHPWDQRVMITALRKALHFAQQSLSEYFQKWVFSPTGESDEEILAFLRETAFPSWHALGTVAMGRKAGEEKDEMKCLDPEFRVYGLKGLRVVDLSACPLILSTHTQSVAYLIAEIASEKIIKEYSLG